jgi:hypothetical protein
MQRYAALRNILVQPNSHSIGVMKLLDKYYPAFAKKVLHKNPLVKKMVENNFCNLDILIYPICGRCETLASYFSYAILEGQLVGVCKCHKCHTETLNPITFKDWCIMELKKKAPDTIESDLEAARDIIAEKLMAQAQRLYRKTVAKEIVYE